MTYNSIKILDSSHKNLVNLQDSCGLNLGSNKMRFKIFINNQESILEGENVTDVMKDYKIKSQVRSGNYIIGRLEDDSRFKISAISMEHFAKFSNPLYQHREKQIEDSVRNRGNNFKRKLPFSR